MTTNPITLSTLAADRRASLLRLATDRRVRAQRRRLVALRRAHAGVDTSPVARTPTIAAAGP